MRKELPNQVRVIESVVKGEKKKKSRNFLSVLSTFSLLCSMVCGVFVFISMPNGPIKHAPNTRQVLNTYQTEERMPITEDPQELFKEVYNSLLTNPVDLGSKKLKHTEIVKFEPNQSNFHHSAFEETLNFLEHHPDATVQIIGHSDPLRIRRTIEKGYIQGRAGNDGNRAFKVLIRNLESLSLMRAIMVKENLLEKIDLKGEQLICIGKGVREPFTGLEKDSYIPAKIKSKEAWESNMRVEIRIFI